MRFTISVITLFFIISCHYPDIDDVPDFNDVSLSDEEIIDYCSNLDTNKTTFDKCVDNLKNNN